MNKENKEELSNAEDGGDQSLLGGSDLMPKNEKPALASSMRQQSKGKELLVQEQLRHTSSQRPLLAAGTLPGTKGTILPKVSVPNSRSRPKESE